MGAHLERIRLKAECLVRLDRVATEHPAGHQGKYSARYVLHGRRGRRVGIMFEKGPNTPAHLWLPRDAASPLMDSGIEYRLYPATDLYGDTGADTKPQYSRHSGLKPMRDLANIDLVRFTINDVSQIEEILVAL